MLVVIENPWAGQGFVDDLSPGIDEIAPQLGELLAPRVVEALGAPLEAKVYPGKGAEQSGQQRAVWPGELRFVGLSLPAR